MEVKLRNYLKIEKEILLMVISGVFDIENQASAGVAWVRSNVHGFIRSSFYLTSLPHLQKRGGGAIVLFKTIYLCNLIFRVHTKFVLLLGRNKRSITHYSKRCFSVS